MTEMPDRLETLFAAAVAIPKHAERAQFLEEACADDPGMRARLEALLRAHDQASHLLDRPAVADPGTAAYGPSAREGAVIADRYKLLEKIGEGGMGTVWVADQMEPVKRKVALKLIQPGMDSKTVLARFEAERWDPLESTCRHASLSIL